MGDHAPGVDQGETLVLVAPHAAPEPEIEVEVEHLAHQGIQLHGIFRVEAVPHPDRQLPPGRTRFAEEGREQIPRFGGADFRRDFGFPEGTGVGRNPEHGAAAEARVRGSVDDAAHPGVDQRAGAHRARLLRDIDRHVLHAPVAAQQFKLVQQLKLGVGGCASALLDPVAGGNDRLAAYDGDGADRNLSGPRRLLRLLKRKRHKPPVAGIHHFSMTSARRTTVW